MTDKAELSVSLRFFTFQSEASGNPDHGGSNGKAAAGRNFLPGIYVIAGRGVGIVTKPGLPVRVGEPAINPVPRKMLSVNLTEELVETNATLPPPSALDIGAWSEPPRPYIFVPFQNGCRACEDILLELELEVPKGEKLARRTLNPRLGVLGGISILGTTGLVKPFSHEAYEQTIRTALSVAASSGCKIAVLSTGGKSENCARKMLSGLKAESFVQIGDFFSLAVQEAQKMDFSGIIHSVFFGKAIKMAQGQPYTHAHKASLDIKLVAELAERLGYEAEFHKTLASANTARHALDLLISRGATDVCHEVARQGLEQSVRISKGTLKTRVLLFDHDGNLLADVAND